MMLVSLALATLVAAQQPQTTTASPSEGDRGDRMVCKRARQTGTRVGTRRCQTAAQWERMSEEHRRAMTEVVDRPQIEIRRE